MRKHFMALLWVVGLATAMAIPAKRGQWRLITLEDGRQVQAELRGDERLRYWQAADGSCYIKNGAVYLPIEISALAERAATKAKSVGNGLPSRRRRIAHSSAVGSRRGIIILVEFADKKFKSGHDAALYQRIVNERGYQEGSFRGSMRDYFLAQSNGLFDIQFDVAGPYTLPNGYAYYGRDTGVDDEDAHAGEMVYLACKAAANDVQWKDYDWDGDGEVEQVYVVYAGYGQADSNDDDTVWPHKWELSDPDNDYGKVYKSQGYTIDVYACGSELSGSGRLAGIGTMCHEFSHCLGLPDMYDTVGNNFGMGDWDLLSSGSYNGDGFCPPNFTSYERWFCGWSTPVELSADTEVGSMKSLSDNGNSYVIYNPAYPDEYYMLENRQQTAWDAALPGNGLLILHVDYDDDAWEENEVNTIGSHQRCTIFHADSNSGTRTSQQAGDAYPYYANDSLTRNSTPPATLYHANSDGSKLMNCAITQIRRNDDGTMAFHYAPVAMREVVSNFDTLFYESFDQCKGKGGNDNLWKGSIAVSKFQPDHDDLRYENAYGANQCAKMGATSKYGWIQTPAITINGEVEVSFRAAPWNEEQNFIFLTVYSNDKEVLNMTLDEMTQHAWKDYSVNFTGNSRNSIMIRSNQNRFFIDEILVKKVRKDDAGIRTATTRTDDRRIYNLQGHYLGTNLDALPKGVYIIGKRKVVK